MADMIDRQKAIDAAIQALKCHRMITDALMELPSAQPKPSTAWHKTYDEGFPSEAEQVLVTDGEGFWLDESVSNDVGLQWESGCSLWEKTEWAYPADLYYAHSEPCEDAVSRKDLEKVAEDFKSFVNWLDMPRDDWKGIISYIDDMLKVPSVTPMRTGKWIDVTNDESIDVEWKCSECGFIMYFWCDKTNFCPNCGAKMEGGE